MATLDFSLRAMPDWYNAERETQKTIEKLGTVKELGHYLRNTDEYIRRLAILKLGKLPAREASNALKEVLDDRLESEANKYLAAWVLKSLSVRWDFDIFENVRHFDEFSGVESYGELFGSGPEDEIPPVRFDFSASPSRSAFSLEAEESARTGELCFETGFDFRQWYSSLGARLLKSIVKALSFIFLKLPAVLAVSAFSGLKRMKRTSKRGSKKVRAVSTAESANSAYDYYSMYRDVYKKPGVAASVKKGLFNMLYLLFFPLRFALKHKLAVLCSLTVLYVLFGYTDYGRAFTNKYMGFDLKDVQKSAVSKAKYYSGYAFNEFNRLTGIDEWKSGEDKKQDDQVVPVSAAEKKIYTVTAQNGLNIRKLPDGSAEKLGSDALPFGSKVVYLSKTRNDSSGKPWYYVQSGDGRTGWVSARFLQEEKEG